MCHPVWQAVLKMPEGGRRVTKEHRRDAFGREWEAFCVGEAAWAWNLLQNPATVAALAASLQRLSKSKPKPKL